MNGKICTFQELTNKKDVLEVNRWRYAQLKHFVESLPQPIRSEDSLLPLERLCSATDGRRGISRIYKILNGLKILGPPPFIKKWEEEMGTGDMGVDVCKILRLTHATSSDCSSTEINYKCLARWYITPDKLHQYQRDALIYAGGDVWKLELCPIYGGHALK